MIPLGDLPPGWTPGKSGTKYIESFNADNLYEKIDGRAESFLQYGVKGMAYTFYHPTGDPSNELQLYVFEMADALKALGKYGSEKPDEAKVMPVGDEGYTAAGSTLFYAGKYYTQIVSTQDDPKFAAFALELARRVAARQKPGGSPAPAAGRGISAGLGAGSSSDRRIHGEGRGGSARRRQSHGRGHARNLFQVPAGRGQAGRQQVRRPGRLWL